MSVTSNIWQMRLEKAAARKKKRRVNARFIADTGGKPIKIDRVTVRAQLDHLYSLVIRRRDRKARDGYCLVCCVKRDLGFSVALPNPISNCYHILPRGDDSVRWHPENAVGSCWPCNAGEKWARGKDSSRAKYRAIHAGLIGLDRLTELEALAKTRANFTTAELVAKRDELKSVLEGK